MTEQEPKKTEMSGFQFYGRRVADSKPVIREGGKDVDELQNAWDGMAKAKSALRRAEFRVSDVDKPKGSYLSGTQLDEYVSHDQAVPIDKIPSYKIMENQGSSDSDIVKVDKFGKTTYMKSKQDRKVVRLEDRYQEKGVRQRSPLREPNSQPSQPPGIRDSGPPRSSYLTTTTTSSELPGHASYSGHRSSNDVDSYLKGDKYSTASERDVTSSTAIRDTELNFPNDFIIRPYNNNSQPSRLHHVDVKVPSEQPKSSLLGAKNVPVRHVTSLNGNRRREGSKPDRMYHGILNGLEKPSNSTSSNGSEGTNTTYTVGDLEAQRKMQKTLKDISAKTDGLERVRELIRQQRMNIGPKDSDSARSSLDQANAKRHHHDDEPVAPKKYAIYEADKPASSSRKIAAGPPAPTYKGFNTTETKYQLPDGKVVKLSDLQQKKKAKRERIIAKAQEEKKVQVPGRQTEDRAHIPVPASPEKPRKVAKKPSKYQTHQDIITTTSWRAGQKLVMKELGPNKAPKLTNSPPTKDKPDGHESDFLDGAVNSGAASRDPSTAKKEAPVEVPQEQPLSRTAKDVLADLHLDQSDSEGEGGGEGMAEKDTVKSPPKRARAKSPEHGKEQKGRRVRHYDSNEVRRYILRQKADRRRQESAEREARQRAEEERQRQLKELYNKQQEAARSKARQKHEAASLQGRLRKSKGESDKENRSRSDGSSDSGTLTENRSRGESLNESLEEPLRGLPPPATKPRPSVDKPRPSADRPHPSLEDHMETANELIAKYVADQAGKQNDPVPATAGALTVAEVMKKFTSDTGMTTDDIISKYAGRAQAIGGPSASSVPSSKRDDHVDSARSLPPSHLELMAGRPLSASTGTSYRSRAERIASLCTTASSLATRVQMESQRLAKEMGPEKWAYPRLDEEEDDYIGRYQRIGGTKRDVFSSDLPGMKSLSAVDSERQQKVAATKIQAAYRGHHTRQSMGWQMPEYRSLPQPSQRTTHLHISDDEQSELGDSTITENSIGDGTDYIKMKDGLRASKAVPRWTAPKADPYSVINVYTRRQAESASWAGAGDVRDQGDPASDITSHHSRSLRTRSPQPVSARSDDYKSDFETGKSLSYRSDRSAQSSSYKDDFTEPSATRGQIKTSDRRGTDKTALDRISSHRSKEEKRIITGSEARVSVKDDDSLEYEDTLDGTLTHSLDSDEAREKSGVPAPHGLQRSANVDLASDMSGSGMSEPEEAPTKIPDPLLHNMPPSNATRSGYGGVTRMSPAALESRMALELNLLESMEESVRQLTDVERSRAVSLAQQETVSLAQILKARQQHHSRDMAELQLKAQQESLAASRQLEEARHRASDATQTAALTISQVRGDATSSLQEASKQLIESQLKASQATADVAKTLAEAQVSLGQRSAVMSEDAITKATTAAAKAAVEATLQNYRHIPGKATGRAERSTQYSERSTGGSTRDTIASHTTDVSRSEMSNGSYMTDSFDESYTRSDPSDPSTKYLALAAKKQAEVKKSTGSDSEASEIQTASDLSPRGRDKDSVKTASVITASDLSPKALSLGELSSVATESAAQPPSPASKSESIAEEIHSDLDRSEKDYSLDFDTSVTEEDMEKSMREMIPTESLRKRFKSKSGGSTNEVKTEEPSIVTALPHIAGPSDARRLSFEEDSFTKFTVEMVKQYMREEETRAQHQNTLLKLREQALKEKIKAELAWIKQQQQRTRKKGEDDVYPMLKKKERGLIRRLQQEQAEIKRLQEANRAASKERKMLLLQSQEIAKLRQSTQQIKQKLRDYKSHEHSASSESLSLRLSLSDHSLSGSESTSCVDEVREKIKKKGGEPSEATSVATDIATEDELSVHLDDGESSQPTSPRKEEMDMGRPPSPSDSRVMQKLKKMKLEGKYLTVREQRLQQRRKKAEELIAWNRRLDEEEAEIERIEKQAKTKKTLLKKDKGVRPLEQAVGKDTLQLTPRTPHTPRDRDISRATTIDESIATETSLATEKPGSSVRSRTQKSITEEISTAISATSRTQTRPRTLSESSVQEDISEAQDDSEIHTETRTKKTHDESPDETGVNTSANESYSNETFDSATETQAPTTAAKSVATASVSSPRPQSRLSKLAQEGGLELKSPKSPAKAPHSPSANGRKGSGSESDDSMTLGYSETASDQSDVETRIRTLSDELKRRKLEAEKLKKEKKKRLKDKLHEQEKSLKKQIEAYDVYISQVKTEITGDNDLEAPRSPVRPQIKQPSESKQRRRPAEEAKADEAKAGEAKARSESESSKSSFEDPTVSVATSPIAAGPNDTMRQQESPSPLRVSKQAAELISEESKKTSTPVKSSRSGEEQEVSEEIGEDLPSVVYSETFTSDRTELRLKLDQDRDGDVTPRDKSQAPDKMPDTARSLSEIAEEYSVKTARSETDQQEDEEGAGFHLDLKEGDEKVPLSARSEYSDRGPASARSESERALSARSESEKAPLSARSESARSDYTYEDESDISSRTDTRSSETKTYSQNSESISRSSSRGTVDSQKRDQSDASEVIPQRPLSAKSEPKPKSSEKVDSIAESLPTEEDISEDLGEELDEDQPLFDLNTADLPQADVQVDLQPIPREEDPLRNFTVGDRVLIGGVQQGILRFKGYTKFSTGFWGGVELEAPEGSNNGSKDGVSYFRCKDNHGIFAPPDKLSLAPPAGSVPEVGEESDGTVTETEDRPPRKSLQEEITAVNKPAGQAVEDEEHSVAESAVTVDSEMENLIRSTSQAVEQFAGLERVGSPADTIPSEGGTPRDVTPRDLAKKEESVEELITDTGVGESTSEKASRTPREESVNCTTELTINNLLNEAISQMITIRHQRQGTPPPTTPEETLSHKQQLMDEDENDEFKIEKDKTENETKKSLLGLDDAALALLRPKSPEPTIIKQNDLDSIYKELEAIGGDDEWFDDEFELGLGSKPPPPYPEKSERPGKIDYPELRLDLQKLTEDLYFAVPHKQTEVTPLVDEVVDVFWEMRRYGESWDEVSVPDTFYKAEDKSADIEGRSKHAHRRLVFDLTAEILRDMYQEEEEVETSVWEKPPQTSKRRYNKNKTPPTTCAELKPIVQDMVLEVLQVKGKSGIGRSAKKWGGRKKKDRVDQILVAELREEEPDWVNYDADELSVKMQLADTLFESLLSETTKVMGDITRRRAPTQHTD